MLEGTGMGISWGLIPSVLAHARAWRNNGRWQPENTHLRVERAMAAMVVEVYFPKGWQRKWDRASLDGVEISNLGELGRESQCAQGGRRVGSSKMDPRKGRRTDGESKRKKSPTKCLGR